MATKRQHRGRISQHEERQRVLWQMLLEHYRKNREFMAGFDSLMARHQQLFRGEGKSVFTNNVSGARLPSVEWMERQRPLSNDLAALASRWGLLCDWAVPSLHHSMMVSLSVAGTGIGPLLIAWLPSTWLPRSLSTTDLFVHRLRIDVPYDAREDWQVWVKRVLEPEARRQRDEFLDSLSKVGIRKRDTESMLERDIRWLYERTALKLTPPRKMQALARGEGAPEDLRAYAQSGPGFEFTYRDATRKRARQLGIRFRQGRPPKGD
jgi:hypothetical protein